jgi:hypothetical protein
MSIFIFQATVLLVVRFVIGEVVCVKPLLKVSPEAFDDADVLNPRLLGLISSLCGV